MKPKIIAREFVNISPYSTCLSMISILKYFCVINNKVSEIIIKILMSIRSKAGAERARK